MNAHDYQTQAARIDDDFRRAVGALRTRTDLSEQGKFQEVQTLEAQRSALVDKLQAAARQDLAAQHAAAQQVVSKEAVAQETARRELLGVQTYADILRASVALLTPAQITAWTGEAHDTWTRAALLEFGTLELRRRVNDSRGKDEDAGVQLRMLSQLDTAPQESGAVREARQVLERVGNVDALVAQLDVKAHRERMAGIFNVSAEHVPAPEG